MASSIDSAKPVSGSPTTSSVRDNFDAARNEINRLLRSSEDYKTNTSGNHNALTVDFAHNVELTAGTRITVKAAGANTGSVTLQCDGGAVEGVILSDNSALSGGEIEGAKHFLDLIFDGADWILLNPANTTAYTHPNHSGDIESSGDGATTLTAAGLLKAWPLNSIYISTSGINPGTAVSSGGAGIGSTGDWEVFGTGKVLVGYQAGHSSFGVSGGTAGAETSTVDVTVPRDGWGDVQSGSDFPEPSTAGRLVTGSGTSEYGEDLESLAHASADKTITSTGGSTLQPSITVHMWKRI